MADDATVGPCNPNCRGRTNSPWYRTRWCGSLSTKAMAERISGDTKLPWLAAEGDDRSGVATTPLPLESPTAAVSACQWRTAVRATAAICRRRTLYTGLITGLHTHTKLSFAFKVPSLLTALTWSAEAEQSSRGSVKGSGRVKLIWSHLPFPGYFRVPTVQNWRL